MRSTWLGLVVIALLGCLEQPAGANKAGYSALLLDEFADVPTIEDDAVLRARIDANDGMDALTISLRSGYSGGNEIRYWDFGVVPSGAKPMWVFRRHGLDGKPEDFGHYDLIDSIPGDTGHTPFRMVYVVYVTALYAEQRITSPQALEDALELGLLEEPQWKDTYANMPVVLAGAELEVGTDEQPLQPRPVYYRGHIATHFKLDDARGPASFSLEKPPIPSPNAYLLRRQNEAKSLDEWAWRADLNGDGDMTDTNVVFSAAPEDMGYTSVWKQIDVVVPADYTWGQHQTESAIFLREMANLKPVPGALVEYQDSLLYLNRPIQRSAP